MPMITIGHPKPIIHHKTPWLYTMLYSQLIFYGNEQDADRIVDIAVTSCSMKRPVLVPMPQPELESA